MRTAESCHPHPHPPDWPKKQKEDARQAKIKTLKRRSELAQSLVEREERAAREKGDRRIGSEAKKRNSLGQPESQVYKKTARKKPGEICQGIGKTIENLKRRQSGSTTSRTGTAMPTAYTATVTCSYQAGQSMAVSFLPVKRKGTVWQKKERATTRSVGEPGGPHTARARNTPIPYKPVYGLNIVCKDENEQIKLFERLKAESFKVKVVNV